jgi:hypothetical protein
MVRVRKRDRQWIVEDRGCFSKINAMFLLFASAFFGSQVNVTDVVYAVFEPCAQTA